MRYFLELSYLGKGYHGWQRQPNALSIQEVVEDTISLILREKIDLVAAGRTDTGVHAKQLFCHFDCGSILDARLIGRLNSALPNTIAVRGLYLTSSQAHARFSAISRTYCYYISQRKDPFMLDKSWFLRKPLDLELMSDACEVIKGSKGFQSFCRSGSDVKTYICEVMECEWTKEGTQLIFRIKADRFLRNMVRAIVGTMILIGEKKMKIEELVQVLKQSDRSKAGPSAPADGLFLMEVAYPENLITHV